MVEIEPATTEDKCALTESGCLGRTRDEKEKPVAETCSAIDVAPPEQQNPCVKVDKLNRGDVRRGIGRVRGKITDCGDRYADRTTGPNSLVIMVVEVNSDGDVQSARPRRRGSALHKCVAAAVRQAKFRPTKSESTTFVFPIFFGVRPDPQTDKCNKSLDPLACLVKLGHPLTR